MLMLDFKTGKFYFYLYLQSQSIKLIYYNQFNHYQPQMIRPTSFNNSLIEQKPRKKINIDVLHDKSYNQFEGNSQIDCNQLKQEDLTRNDPDFTQSQFKKYKNNQTLPNLNQQISQYSKIFTLVAKEGHKFKKVDDLTNKNQKSSQNNNKNTINQKSSYIKVEGSTLKKQEQTPLPTIKFQQGQQEIQTQKLQKEQIAKTSTPTPKVKTPIQPSSNWKKFLQQSATLTQNQKSQSSIIPSKFVSIDCQFVKCGESDELARISLISQHGQTIYDSYIKPAKKVTDYVTAITGITFSHLKNAPSWEQQTPKVKKLLINKILVGHTLHKDLQVCKLTDWKGISQKIDISQFSLYRQKNGSKVVSLKRMALSFLNKNIQSGWHSSVQDATVTMELFKLNKKKMLKQFKII